MEYYCHNCALKKELLSPASSMNLTGTQYQLDKYIKHTAPTGAYNYNTVFTGAASVAYQNHAVSAVSSGHVQIDDLGRRNILWAASAHTGIKISGGKVVGPTDAVKVVLHHDSNKVHAFPVHTSDFGIVKCHECGVDILT